MTRPAPRLVLAGLAAAAMFAPASAHPGADHDEARIVAVEPVRSSEEARRVLSDEQADRGALSVPALSVGMSAPKLEIAAVKVAC